VTLYELTFGKLPFQLSGRTIRERLDAHLTQAPSFPEPWPETIPEAWRDVLQRMLAKNPTDRYSNYAELMADLARLLPRRLIPAPRPSRAIAWLFDAILLTVAQGIVVGPALLFQVLPGTPATGWNWVAGIIGTFLSGVLLLVAIWAQCRWSATPGKMFFQLGIVDAHGLRPSRRNLSLRILFQFPWIGLFFAPLFTLIGLSVIESFLALAALLVTLVSFGFFLIRRDQRALHDIILRTQVVVQAGDDS
jgi:uncharacterized RDD family membrane protein YckC